MQFDWTSFNNEICEKADEHQQREQKLAPTKFWSVAYSKMQTEDWTQNIESFRRNKNILNFFEPTFRLEGLHFFNRALEFKEQMLTSCHSSKGASLMEQLFEGYHLALASYSSYVAGDIPDKKPLLHECFDSGIGQPIQLINFEGRNFSRAMLNYMNALVFLKRNIDDTSCIKNILEIGGGFGSLGEILYKDTANSYNYIDIDILPTVVASSYYLSKIYSENFSNCLTFDDDDFIDYDKMNNQAYVLGNWQISRIKGSVDLFVNLISFQEMEPSVVRMYIEHIARLNTKYVLIRNIMEGKNPAKVLEPIKSSDYDIWFEEHGYCLKASNVIPYGFKTADGFHSELKIYYKK